MKPYIRITRAKLCADIECGTVYEGDSCPICAGREFIWLSAILDRKDAA